MQERKSIQDHDRCALEEAHPPEAANKGLKVRLCKEYQNCCCYCESCYCCRIPKKTSNAAPFFSPGLYELSSEQIKIKTDAEEEDFDGRTRIGQGGRISDRVGVFGPVHHPQSGR